MSKRQTQSLASPFVPNDEPLGEVGSGFGNRLAAKFGIWTSRAATRRALAYLDAQQLVDIGRSDAERRRECAKWFWQS
jgi:uncharacterized protein YjiS (DUF1127 family)